MSQGKQKKKDFVFFCGLDKKRLILADGKYSAYRRCENYEFRNREKGEAVCMNRLSLQETATLRSDLEEKMATEGIAEGDVGMAGHISYEIGEINSYFITVYIVNTKRPNKQRR